MSPVRTLERDQLQWRVYEVSTLAVPGAPVPRCLIFDSDAVVRRCWIYPADWAKLDDEALWTLLSDSTKRPAATVHTMPATGTPLDEIVQSTVELIATSRSLASESRLLRDSNRALREERKALLESCHESRAALFEAVARYAIGLKNSGMPPELTIVLVKDAIRDGLGGAAQAEEPDGVALMGDGVAYAIKAYYAA